MGQVDQLERPQCLASGHTDDDKVERLISYVVELSESVFHGE